MYVHWPVLLLSDSKSICIRWLAEEGGATDVPLASGVLIGANTHLPFCGLDSRGVRTIKEELANCTLKYSNAHIFF